MFSEVVLLEGATFASDQCKAGVGDKDPNNRSTGVIRTKARLRSRRVDIFFKETFLRENAETQVPGNRVAVCKETDRRCRCPVILKSNHEIVGVLTFALVADDQCEKHLPVHVSPPSFVPLLHGGLKRSLAAGWFSAAARESAILTGQAQLNGNIHEASQST